MIRYLLIVDTETTAKNHMVADFGAVVVDLSRPRDKQVVRELGIFVWDAYNHPLWFNPRAPKGDFWHRDNLKTRQKQQESYVDEGERALAVSKNINKWLKEVFDEFNPICTAYNWKFDKKVCANTGINLEQFQNGPQWCLYNLAKKMLVNNEVYRNHCLANGYVTEKGNIQFTADSVSNFIFWSRGEVKGAEPHTALEDAKMYELPIAQELFAHGWLDDLKTTEANEGDDDATE